ncbi:MAG: Gfo/Idh/MocA family protein [Bacteroidia bacterium]
MAQQKKIRFAVIGFGHIGARHAEEISSNTFAELVAIADIDPRRLKVASDIYSAVRTYSSLQELLDQESDKVDVVNICTPNGLHFSQAQDLLLANKHILVEKPLALRKSHCNELIKIALKKEKKIFCVLQNRYSPPAQLLKSLVDNQNLGKIGWVEINCFWNRDERYYTPGSWRGTKELDGGPLYTQFSHFVDILYWLFGGLEIQNALFDNFNHPNIPHFEDTGMFSFKIISGGAGIFSYSTMLWDKNMESTITIIGDKGTVKIGGQYMDKIEYFHVEDIDKPDLAQSNPPNSYGNYQGSAANHSFVIENIVRELNGEKSDIAYAEDATASVEIIEQVYDLRKMKA